VTWYDQSRDQETTSTHSHVFLMTGATPNTAWLDGCVTLDEKGFVKTGMDLSAEDLKVANWPLQRRRSPLRRVFPESLPQATYGFPAPNAWQRPWAMAQPACSSFTRPSPSSSVRKAWLNRRRLAVSRSNRKCHRLVHEPGDWLNASRIGQEVSDASGRERRERNARKSCVPADPNQPTQPGSS
jgi:hypothetical protein